MNAGFQFQFQSKWIRVLVLAVAQIFGGGLGTFIHHWQTLMDPFSFVSHSRSCHSYKPGRRKLKLREKKRKKNKDTQLICFQYKYKLICHGHCFTIDLCQTTASPPDLASLSLLKSSRVYCSRSQDHTGSFHSYKRWLCPQVYYLFIVSSYISTPC